VGGWRDKRLEQPFEYCRVEVANRLRGRGATAERTAANFDMDGVPGDGPKLSAASEGPGVAADAEKQGTARKRWRQRS